MLQNLKLKYAYLKFQTKYVKSKMQQKKVAINPQPL